MPCVGKRHTAWWHSSLTQASLYQGSDPCGILPRIRQGKQSLSARAKQDFVQSQ
jgi:hypothetical protein